MRYGVFSDVHGNYEALKAVLEFYRKNAVADFVCCGDVVGYGPQPQECADALRSLGNLRIVMGNHDAALAGKMETRWFNANAAWAIEFSRKVMSGQALAYVAALPERVETPDFTVVHGSPRKPLTEYVLSEGQFSDNLKGWSASPCFVGHSHMPQYFREGPGGVPETDFLKPAVRVSAAQGKVMINPGSVGQPRDGDPRAACGIYDTATKNFELYRVFYDVEKVQRMMEGLGMPALLAGRLSFGF